MIYLEKNGEDEGEGEVFLEGHHSQPEQGRQKKGEEPEKGGCDP